MKKIANLLLVVIMLISSMVSAQTAPASSPRIGIGTPTPHASSALDITSTSKGFLMPRMSTVQRDAIASPAAGLMIYNLDANKPNFFNGISWIELTGVIVGGATQPGVPTDIIVTAGDAQASVAFTAPTNNGGSAITNYIVTANPGELTAQGTASPITVTGLVNGTAYTFTVVAVNAVGNSVSSTVSSAVTPVGAPGAPTDIVASYTAGTTEASVAFTAPTITGGAAITGYTVTSNPGSLTASGATSPLVLTGLTMNQAYTFTVVANNGSASVASAASNTITTVPVVPSAPLNLVASSSTSGSASLTFNTPTSNGGGTITNYVVTSIPAGGSGSGSASPIAVSGLTNGTSYTFTLVAQNSAGDSPASAASNAVTPIGAPDAPTAVAASYTQGDTTASIAFTAPANTGGATITGYTVTSSPGGLTATGTSSPIVISNLVYGTSYTFSVVANNGTYNSVASSPSTAISVAIAAPGAPSKVDIVAANSNTLTWKAPTTGGPVQSYTIQTRATWGATFVSTTWTDKATVSGTTLTWTDAVNLHKFPATSNIEYHYRVVATNTSGSATSQVVSGTPVEGSTVLVHDGFNEQPSTPKWEYVPNGGFANSWAGYVSNLDPLYIDKMYGQADGRWKLERPAGINNGVSASTAGLINRVTDNIVIQFDYMPVNGSFGPQDYHIGLVDQAGRLFSMTLNNATNQNGVTVSSFTGSDWNTALGAAAATPSGKNINGSAVSTASNTHVHYKIILPSSGGIQIYINGLKQQEWSATEVPAAYTNLKFYANAKPYPNGSSWANIDNFTILKY